MVAPLSLAAALGGALVPFKVEIKSAGEGALADDVVDGNYLFFVALNTIHTGKGMRMAPHAKLNDGLIDTILVRDVSKLRAVKIFTQVFSGSHIFDPSVEYQQVKTFSIHTKGDLLNIDGENIGRTPIDVSVVPNALQIFADF